jgi:hypothetical protein
MPFVRGTGIPSVIFVLVSMAVWGTWLGWDAAVSATVPVAFLTPPIWWWIAARAPRRPLLRAGLAGAAIGLLAQLTPILLDALFQLLSRRRQSPGDIAGLAYAVIILWALIAAPIGAIVGVLASQIQRRLKLG